MIRIAVVDDEVRMRETISKYIVRSLQDQSGIQIEIHDSKSDDIEKMNEKDKDGKGKIEIRTYSGAEEFLYEVRSGKKFDILFTDIQMGIMDGMELGKTLRDFQPDLYIIFITSYAEYAAQSYVIGVYQYILKQDMEYRIPIVIRSLVEMINKRSNSYRMVGTLGDKKKLYCRDIIYIQKEKGGKYVNFVTLEGIYRERVSIERLYQEMENEVFILVERSYIINMERISRLTGNAIVMENGAEVKISRTRLPEVKKAIDRYWRNK